MKIGIVAGEKSGDLLASQLISALKESFPEASFTGLCGPMMIKEGAISLDEMDKISIFGLEGLFGSIREILKIRKNLYQHFIHDPPDVFIGVDVPDFNLTLERKLRMQGIPTVHYVSPTVWAWRGGRIKKIKKAVDLMLTLFPFEEPYYQKNQVPVRFVGHPMAKEALNWNVPDGFRETLLGNGEKLIAVLPGSRMSEVTRLAKPMIETASQLVEERPELRFAIPAANPKIEKWLSTNFPKLPNAIQVIDGNSRDLLYSCDMAVVASGTAALETALFAKPMVVMYKVSKLSALVFGHTITVEHFSMPNHLTKPPAVKELIQEQANAENLRTELLRLLDDKEYFLKMQSALSEIAPMLNKDSSHRAAEAIMELVNAKVTS